MLLEQPAGITFVVQQSQQKQFTGNEFVAALGRFLVGEIEQIAQIARGRNFPALPFYFRQVLDGFFQRRFQTRNGDACARKQ